MPLSPKLVRRGLIALAAVAVVVVLVLAWLPDPVPVEIAEVTRGALREVVLEDGRTRVQERYEISAPVAGTLVRVEVEPGDWVGEGDPLARIVPTPAPLLDERTRSELRARVGAAEAAVQQARATVQGAESAVALAGQEVRRQEVLLREESGTQYALERARLELRSREQALEAARAAERVAVYEAEMARNALARSSGGSGAAEEIVLTAPTPGRILGVLRESEGTVQPGTPILELADPSRLEVVVDVLSQDAVRVSRGATVLLERWGGDEILHGRVRRVDPSAFTRISALGVEEQRVDVVVEIDGEAAVAAGLGDGFRVEARIVVWEGEEVLRVPSSALLRVRGEWSVFRVEGGRAHVTPIRVGHRSDEAAEVLEGLEPGDRVVLYPGDRVVDGVRVEPRGG